MAALARFSRVFGLKGAEINLIRGAVHCTAVAWDGESGWTLRVCEVSPASLGEDPFVLQFCRASADALLQTGTNMRAEPGFWPAWTGAAFSDALDAHRAELGKRPGPLPVVLLTRGAQHSRPSQFLAEWGNDIAVCGPPGVGKALRAAVSREMGREAVHIVGGLEQSHLGPADAIAFAQRRYGETVLVEAGPTTTGALYPEDGPSGVDAVVLSEVEGPVPEAAMGPHSVSRRMLAQRADLECVAEARPTHADDAGRRWTYSLWRRR